MHPPANIFEQLLSKPRLDSYRGYWKISADEAVGIYMWNGEICSCLSQLLAYFEITLRNNIHRTLSLSTGGGGSSSTHWWDVYWAQLTQETRNKIASVRSEFAPASASPDEIVARLSFGFWPNMLSWIGKNRPALLIQIFPGHPLSQAMAPNWMTKPARRTALNSVFELKDIRNRIAHHEPLWKFSNIVDTSGPTPVVIAPASTNEATSIVRFIRLLALYDNLLVAISPPFANHIRQSSWRQQLDFLLSERGRTRYKNGSHIPIADSVSPAALNQLFANWMQKNRPVRLRDAGGSGLFIPN
jgi:hypothetical protein